MTGQDLDNELAADLAARAGALLLALRCDGGFEGRALGDAGDARANDLILNALAQARPADAVLSEESADDPARLAASRVWIIDPLDGTREYCEGRDDWAVHVALAENGVPTAGAVAIPARNLVLRADTPPRPTPPADPPRLLSSRTRPCPVAAAAAERLDARLIPMGSAGAKAAAVIMGEADAYIHSGVQSEWDNCAPVAVAQAAGLHCSHLDGTPLRYNRADVRVDGLLICHPELVKRLL
ncbi:MAG: 3'(2'),5'-bisphosphate nucleotidase CysQ [Pseudomonadota bacterium]